MQKRIRHTCMRAAGWERLRCCANCSPAPTPEQFPYPADCEKLGGSAGFQLEKAYSLEHIPAASLLKDNRVRWLSVLFSRIGWLKGRFSPGLARANRRWRKNEQRFVRHGRFLEGWLFVHRKET